MRGVISISEPSPPFMAKLAECVLLSAHQGRSITDVAKAIKAPDEVLKAIQLPMTSGDGGMAGLVNTLTILTSFIPSLRNTSIFFRLLDGMMMRVPLNTRATFLTGTIDFTAHTERGVIGVTRVSSDEVNIKPSFAAGILLFSNEMLSWLSAQGVAFLESEIARAITISVDAQFLSLIADGNTPNRPSVGVSPEAALSDLKFLLDSCELKANSKPLFAMAPDVARRAATLYDGNGGGLVFPDMSPQGGELLKLPAIVADALSAGTVALFDGMGIAGDAFGFQMDASREAALQLDSAPDSPPTGSTNLMPLFQNNLQGLKPHVYFGAKRLRASAYSYVSSVAWGSGDSPA